MKILVGTQWRRPRERRKVSLGPGCIGMIGGTSVGFIVGGKYVYFMYVGGGKLKIILTVL